MIGRNENDFEKERSREGRCDKAKREKIGAWTLIATTTFS